jgi:hypothetical protein
MKKGLKEDVALFTRGFRVAVVGNRPGLRAVKEDAGGSMAAQGVGTGQK